MGNRIGCAIIRCNDQELKIVPTGVTESDAKAYAVYFKRLYESKKRMRVARPSKKQIIQVEPDGSERFVNVDL